MKARAKNGRPGPKGRGLFRIVEFTNPSGATAYRVTGWTAEGVRIRQNFTEHAEAVSRMQELEIQSANLEASARAVITRLTPEQAAEAEAAFARLTKIGHGTLLDALDFYASNYREPLIKITVKDAFEKFIAEKTAANLRPHSLTSLRIKTGPLVNHYGNKLVSDITADTLKTLIFLPTRGPKARDNYRRAFSSFFAWAEAQGYTPANPAAKITPIKAERTDPELLSVEQAERLLRAAAAYKDGTVLPYTALALFAGLRPTELARLSWDAIDLESRTITVGARIAKMRGKRIVEITDNLVAWLLPCAPKQPTIKAANWRRDFDAVKELAGITTWPQDIMRHTAISNHLATHQHEGRTATWAGNSPDIIQRFYKGLVKPTDAERFWTIAPEAGQKIVELLQVKM